MNELIKDIEDIKRMLRANLFQDEQHVRFSLVGRICQTLGWNIWDPSEFYTEYKVKKIPLQNLSKDVTGKVDIALFIPEKTSEGAEVFIEVKTAGRLDTEQVSGETQLHLYNAYHKSAISILTDGIKWRFYLPSAGGEFEDKLFNELNLRDDDLDEVYIVFEQILKKENFRKKALDTAEAMREELIKIKLIGKVKAEAMMMHEKTDLSQYMFAHQILLKDYHRNIEEIEIKRLWDRNLPGCGEVKPPKTGYDVKKVKGSAGINSRGKNKLPPRPADEFTFKKVKRLQVLGTWYDVNYWWEVKQTVYNRLISEGLKENTLSKCYGISKDKTIYRVPASLNNGYYTEVSLGSYNVVWHCYVALHALGYDPSTSFLVETGSEYSATTH